jgi:hypothetical protein
MGKSIIAYQMTMDYCVMASYPVFPQGGVADEARIRLALGASLDRRPGISQVPRERRIEFGRR